VVFENQKPMGIKRFINLAVRVYQSGFGIKKKRFDKAHIG
jgi:hypothetical protein